MKLFLSLFSLALIGPSLLFSQSYFQQQTDYKINVVLDTTDKTLNVSCKLNYTNNSNEALDHLYFHIWWNCFNDKLSAFAEQHLEIGSRDFYFADEDELGGYKEIEFVGDNKELYQEYFIDDDNKEHKDIVKVELEKDILPGATKEIMINYEVQIPAFFSRGGWQEDLYRFTQWYPKPAVYDNEGWHQMPYLDIGEFYSEFGNYEMTFDLPESFDLVSTGVITNEEKVNGRKIFSVEAQQVPDVAWFCSDSFVKKTEQVNLSGEQIEISLFTNYSEDYDEVLQYMKDALSHYASLVGPYPYPQYSLVLSDRAERGGMEYPMLSVIDLDYVGQSLDNLVAHEIGHNWFQSALGSNERLFPWMDEGFNSFYERKYNDTKYDSPNNNWMLPRFYRSKNPEFSLMEAGVCHLHCCGKLKKVSQVSADTDIITYGSNAYEKTAFSLSYLESYLGEDVFLEAISTYYTKWLHKHPQPSDVRTIFENVSSEDLSWFFDGLIDSEEKFDYEIVSVDKDAEQQSIKIHNKMDLNLPVELTAYENGAVVHNQWIPIEEQDAAITIPDADYNRISINGQTPFLDINRKNNHHHPGKLFSKAPLNFKFIGQQADSYNRTISILPTVGFNKYNGLMLGIGLHNEFFPYGRTRWFVQPAYGFESKSVAGIAALEHDLVLWKKTKLEKLTLGLKGRIFDYASSPEVQLFYYKLEPSFTLHFDKGLINTSSLDYRLHYISQGARGGDTRANSWIHQLNYRKTKRQKLILSKTLFQLEYESYDNVFEEQHSYLKLSAEKKWSLYYNKKSQLHFRFFGGYFLRNTKRESSSYTGTFTRGSFALSQQGYTDHTYEGYYYGRTEQEGSYSRQLMEEEGGFKLPLGSSYGLDMSNNYLMAINLKGDLPFSIFSFGKFRPFLDLGYISNKSTLSEPLTSKFLYGGGLAFEFGEFLGVYLPLFYSSDYDIPIAGRNLLEKLSFKIDISKLNLWRLSEDPGVLIR